MRFVTCVKLGPTFDIRHSTFANYPQRLVFFKCHRISSININLRPKALPSITADAIFLLPVRRKWPPNVHGLNLWRRLFSIAAYDGGNFRISRQNQSSPGTTRLSRYKRRHISTSGTAQIQSCASLKRISAVPKVEIMRRLFSHFIFIHF